MPERQVQKKESVQPTRNLLSRWFGSDPFTPNIEEGINIARKEMPDLAPVSPYGFFSRLALPKVLGYASGGKDIYLNTKMNQGQSPQEVADTLTHEQSHIRQRRTPDYSPTMNFLQNMFGQQEPYHRRPDEMAAFQAERQRRTKMGRPQTSIPRFDTGEWYIPQDINLPVPRRR